VELQLEVSGSVPAPAVRVVGRARDDGDVLAVALFGSYVRGEHSAISDIDICIFLTSKPREVEEVHGKRMLYTEVAGSGEADVQVFQQLPLNVRSEILKEGRLVLVKDEAALYELVIETIKDFEDFRKHYEEYLAGIANGESR
jgi:predicted nucleotidyltransferase